MEDCAAAGELLGLKTFANEFIAYKKLADIKETLNERYATEDCTRSTSTGMKLHVNEESFQSGMKRITRGSLWMNVTFQNGRLINVRFVWLL